MNRHEISTFALRLLGIIAIMQAIPLLSPFLATLGQGSGGVVMFVLRAVVTLVPFALLVGLGMFLLKNAPALAQRMIPGKEESVQAAPAKFKDMQVFAIAFLGLVFALVVAPKLVVGLSNIVGYVQVVASRGFADNSPLFYFSPLLAAVVQVAAGVWLFLNPEKVLTWWSKRRGLSAERAE